MSKQSKHKRKHFKRIQEWTRVNEVVCEWIKVRKREKIEMKTEKRKDLNEED